MTRNHIASPFSPPTSPYIMTLLPVANRTGSSHSSAKENRDPATQTSPHVAEHAVKVELDTVLDHHVLSNDSNHRNHAQELPGSPFQPRLAACHIAEAEHRSTKGTYNSRVERRQSRKHGSKLQEQAHTIQLLNTRIRDLEKSERRLKSRLAEEKESLKDSKAELQAAHYQASILEERLDGEMGVRKEMEMALERYRGWWLNEYYCLKVAMQMIVDPDDGVEAMRESSRARYLIHLTSQSDSV